MSCDGYIAGPITTASLGGAGTVEVGSGTTRSQSTGDRFTSTDNGGEARVAGRQSLSGRGSGDVLGASELSGTAEVIRGKLVQ